MPSLETPDELAGREDAYKVGFAAGIKEGARRERRALKRLGPCFCCRENGCQAGCRCQPSRKRKGGKVK